MIKPPSRRARRASPVEDDEPPLLGQLELVRPPAPGELEIVRSFMNTQRLPTDTETLDSPAALVAWIRENGLIDRKAKLSATASELARVRRVRAALQAMARRNNGDLCSCDSGELEAASERSRFTVVFDPLMASATLSPTATGVDGALGRILAAVHAAMQDSSWARLKACADGTCASTYYDHSKNGCSRWCSPDTCGNRSKVKRYRERQAQQQNVDA